MKGKRIRRKGDTEKPFVKETTTPAPSRKRNTNIRPTNKKKRNWFSTFCYVVWFLSTVALTYALFMVGNTQYGHVAEVGKAYSVSNFSSDELEENKKRAEETATFNFEDITSLDDQTLAEAREYAKNHDLPVVGGIAVPDVKINLPIFHGVSNYAVAYGAATMKEDQVMGQGNYGLASHQVFTPTTFGLKAEELLFSPLIHVENGMPIYLTDKVNIYKYEIVEKKEVPPSATEVLLDKGDGHAYVTLVTCTDFHATNRIIVTGRLVETKSWESSPKEVRDAFTQKYTAYE